MPQLDFATFLPQLVWLAIAFGLLYWLMSRLVLPRVTEVIEARAQRIAADLDRAAALKGEAEKARAAFESALAEARAQAVALESAAENEAARIASQRQHEQAAALGERIKRAEAEVAAAKAAALGNVAAMASEVVRETTRRLIGVEVDAAEAAGAAAAALRERG
jgi:F-type H+-transporting ATPase subunit b